MFFPVHRSGACFAAFLIVSHSRSDACRTWSRLTSPMALKFTNLGGSGNQIWKWEVPANGGMWILKWEKHINVELLFMFPSQDFWLSLQSIMWSSHADHMIIFLPKKWFHCRLWLYWSMYYHLLKSLTFSALWIISSPDVYIYIYTYHIIYIYTNVIYIYIHYIHTYTHIYIYIHICIHVKYIGTHVCIYIYTLIYIYMCI